jgi:hypothetical protein
LVTTTKPRAEGPEQSEGEQRDRDAHERACGGRRYGHGKDRQHGACGERER